jgi:hypothetical protein
MPEFENVCLITGAGAIENAWIPIIRVLEPDYKFEFDIDSSNCFLALLVYQLRVVASEESHESREHLKLMLQDYKRLKQQLSRSLIYSQQHNQTIVRKEFYSILDKFIFLQHIKSVQITTNWDTLIDEAANFYGHNSENGLKERIKTFHIHGSVLAPETLYLPSEIVKEPYRSKEESLEMTKNHSSVFKTVLESNRTILYGLSLDPLDAELSQILAMGWNSNNTKEIIVINPDHGKVAKRVKLLLNSYNSNVKILAYSPFDLETEIQY